MFDRIHVALFSLIVIILGPPALYGEERSSNDLLTKRARKILKTYCYRCHKGKNSEGGDVNILDSEDWDGFFVTGDADASYAFERIIDGSMPPKDGSELSVVPAEDAEVLRSWISGGTASFDSIQQQARVPRIAVYEAVANHVRSEPTERRRFLRYFTLHNLFNHPMIGEDDLPDYRAALSKVVNSLSWGQRIRVPEPVPFLVPPDLPEQDGIDQLVFAIDIRDYGWDKTSFWEEVQQKYPYGQSFEFADETLHELDQSIQDSTGVVLPVLRADWFIATATRPDLYHTALQIPQDARDLERRLDVDIAAAFRHPTLETIARAGFPRSGVSGQNRMVQRSDSRFGFYWKSYDFKPDTGRANLLRFPLGPVSLLEGARSTLDRFAFEHDGGEIIFSLPNGLQAYMLTDGNDQRIDAGPIEVVSDPLKTSGTPAIINGLSCMACHKTGMINFRDFVRDNNATFDQVEQHVRRIYPEQEQMDGLISSDRRRFVEAVVRAMSPFYKNGNALTSENLYKLPEVVSKSAREYQSTYLDIEIVSSELDLPSTKPLLDLGKRTLKKLGLSSLPQGGLISRADWESFDRRFSPNLMQQTAKEFGITPKRPL